MKYIKTSVILSIYILHKQSGGYSNKRKIIVQGKDSELETFMIHVSKYKNDLDKRNVEIIYKKSPNYKVKLYGYDSEIKKTIRKPDLEDLIKTIDSMPMGKIEKVIRDRFF